MPDSQDTQIKHISDLQYNNSLGNNPVKEMLSVTF